MEVSKTAIVFQGLQTDFCAPEGKLYPLLEEQLLKREFIPRILRLLDEATEKGIRCYFVPIAFTHDYREIKNAEGILGAIREAGAFVKGTTGAEPIPELKKRLDRKNIKELPAKRGLCAFGTTALDNQLQADGIETVAVAGLLTNVCVETTARTAYDLGYRVVVINDATATKSFEEQEASEKYMFPLLGSQQSTSEFLSAVAA
jgi:nicotinamidase-related amidase